MMSWLIQTHHNFACMPDIHGWAIVSATWSCPGISRWTTSLIWLKRHGRVCLELLGSCLLCHCWSNPNQSLLSLNLQLGQTAISVLKLFTMHIDVHGVSRSTMTGNVPTGSGLLLYLRMQWHLRWRDFKCCLVQWSLQRAGWLSRFTMHWETNHQAPCTLGQGLCCGTSSFAATGMFVVCHWKSTGFMILWNPCRMLHPAFPGHFCFLSVLLRTFWGWLVVQQFVNPNALTVLSSRTMSRGQR